jgi:ankyrin repeat protein
VEDGLKVRQHIEAHIMELKARESGNSKVKIWCPDCELQFCHIGDLEWHLNSVERDGTCGFKFAHADSLCVGHHPPMLEDQRHEDHQNFSVRLLAWEVPQYNEFERYVKDFAQGYVPTNAPPPACNTSRPAFRRSTGSLLSIRSQASWLSYLSTPWYMSPSKEPIDSRSSISSGSLQQNLDPARQIQEHISRAMELGQPEVIKQLIEHPGFLEGKISEESLPFTIDASWFASHIRVKRVWCLAVLVEHGMPISVDTVGYLATACQDKGVLRLLLGDGRYMTRTSRLTLCLLCSAICHKKVDVVLNMLNAGVRVSTIGEPLNPPLIAFMETLHEQQAECRYSPRQMGLNWTTDYTLALALDVKDYVIANYLIQHGSNAYNTLIRAAQITDLAALGFLCDRDVHLQSQPVRQRSGICGSPDVLHLLAHSMQCSDRPAGPLLDSARTLITRYIDVNGRDSMLRTALMIICGMSNLDFESGNSSAQILAELLIRGGANVNARDKFYRTPLIHAAIAGNLGMTKLILSKDPAIGCVDYEGQSAVLHALSRNNRHIAELLMKRQGVPTSKVFSEALRSDHKQLACFLLQPSLGENFGRYSQKDQMRLLSTLLEFGDETNDYHVRTVTLLASLQPKSALRLPLQEALSYGRVAFTDSLLRKGAPTKQADIFLALESKNPDTVDLLFDHIPILHVHDAEGRTPLIAAISVGCSRSVSSLLQRHVDVNGMGSGKDTPLKVAYDMGLGKSDPIVILLKEFGGRLVASPDRWSRQSRDERLVGGFLKPFGRNSMVVKGITRFNIIKKRQTLTMPQSIVV